MKLPGRIGLAAIVVAASAFADAVPAPVLRETIRQLASGDEPVRRAATEALVATGSEAVEPLVRAIAHGEFPSSTHELENAIRAMEAAALPELARLLGDEDVRIRRVAARAIWVGERSVVPALPALRDALVDPDDQVRADVLNAIGSAGAASVVAIAELEIVLRRDRIFDNRLLAAMALGDLGAPARRSAVLVAELLDSHEAGWEPRAILYVLQALGVADADIERRLIALHGRHLPRSYIAVKVGAVLDAIGPVTSEGRRIVRDFQAAEQATQTAINELTGLAEPAELIAALARDDEALRRIGVARVPSTMSIEQVRPWLDHPSPGVRLAVAAAVAKSHPETAGRLLARAFVDGDRSLREDVLAVARRLEVPGVLGRVLAEFVRGSPAGDPLREEAVGVLLSAYRGFDGDLFPILLEALASPDQTKRRIGAVLVGRHSRSSEALDSLLRLLDDPFGDVRAAAATALETAGPTSGFAAAKLLVSLEDREAQVREAAARTLGRIDAGGEVVLDALRTMRDSDEHWGVRQAASGSYARLVRSSPARIDLALVELYGSRPGAVKASFENDLSTFDAILREFRTQPLERREVLLTILGRHLETDRSLASRFEAGDLLRISEALRSRDADLQRTGLRVAGALGAAAAPIARDVALLVTGSGELSDLAARALAATADAAALQALFLSGGPGARLIASRILLHRRNIPDELAPAIAEAARDSDLEARRNFALALRLTGERGIQELVRLLEDEDLDLARAAARAARLDPFERPAPYPFFSGASLEPLLVALGRALRSTDGELARAAAVATGSLYTRAAPAAPSLRAALASEHFQVRVAAGRALRRVSAFSIDPLVAALGDGDPRIRRGAADTLGSLYHRAEEAESALIELVEREKDSRVRAAASMAARRVVRRAKDEGEIGEIRNAASWNPEEAFPTAPHDADPLFVAVECVVLPDGSVDQVFLIQGWDPETNDAIIEAAKRWEISSSPPRTSPVIQTVFRPIRQVEERERR